MLPHPAPGVKYCPRVSRETAPGRAVRSGRAPGPQPSTDARSCTAPRPPSPPARPLGVSAPTVCGPCPAIKIPGPRPPPHCHARGPHAGWRSPCRGQCDRTGRFHVKPAMGHAVWPGWMSAGPARADPAHRRQAPGARRQAPGKRNEVPRHPRPANPGPSGAAAGPGCSRRGRGPPISSASAPKRPRSWRILPSSWSTVAPGRPVVRSSRTPPGRRSASVLARPSSRGDRTKPARPASAPGSAPARTRCGVWQPGGVVVEQSAPLSGPDGGGIGTFHVEHVSLMRPACTDVEIGEDTAMHPAPAAGTVPAELYPSSLGRGFARGWKRSLAPGVAVPAPPPKDPP